MQSMTPCPSCAGSGEALGLHEAPARVVEPDQIGEGAADIDRNNNHATEPPRPSAPCAPLGHDVQSCAGLPHRADHRQAPENQRYFAKRQGPQGDWRNANMARGCGGELSARDGGRTRDELPDQTGDDRRTGRARRGHRRARPHAGAALHRSLGPAGRSSRTSPAPTTRSRRNTSPRPHPTATRC